MCQGLAYRFLRDCWKNGELAEQSYQDLEFNLLKLTQKAGHQLEFSSS